MKRVKRSSDRSRARERPVIMRLFDPPRAAVLLDARKLMVLAQHDEREAFVVAQKHVVSGPEALDQLRFEQQRLGLGPRRDDRHRPGLRNHPLQALRQPRDLRVIADPALQRPRLADVEHVAARILHPVHPRTRRQRLPHLADRRDARFEIGSALAAHGIGRLILVETISGAWMVGTVSLAHTIDLGTL